MMRFTSFASGSSGNCSLLSIDGSHILLDAGISCKRIIENLHLSGLTVADLSAVMITHEHSDHINGLKTLINKRFIPVFAPRTVANHLCYTIAGVEQCLQIVSVGIPFSIGALSVTAFPTPHDTPESVGWRIEGKEVFAIATDMGFVTEEIKSGLSGADLVLIEANHDIDMLRSGRYPYILKKRILSDHGHLSNDGCRELTEYLVGKGTKHIILGHLSQENNTPEKAFQTVLPAIYETDARLYVAPASARLTVELERM